MSDLEEEAFSAWAAEPRPGEGIAPYVHETDYRHAQTEAPSQREGAPVPAGGPPGGGAINDAIDNLVVKGILPPGMFMTSDHRYYFNGEGPFPSVTTVIDVMSKPALITWKAKEAARAVYLGLRNDWPELRPMLEEDVVLWALKEADKARDTAASIGSGVHLLADMASRASESDGEGFQIPDHIQPYLEGFRDFLDRYGGSQSILSSEHAIWNLNGYAGTFDLIMLLPCADCQATKPDKSLCVNRETWLIDIKTSKGYYPEYGLQLAAYAHGDFIGLPNDPHRYTMPLIQRAGVLHLRPDMYKEGWRLIEYPITDRDYIAFLGALELYNWREEKRFQKSKLIGT